MKKTLRAVAKAILPRTLYLELRARRALKGAGDAEIRLLTALASNGVFVDVGANIGLWSMSAANIFRQVHAFEPDPALARMLRRILPRNVVIHDVALSNREGVKPLLTPVFDGEEITARASIEPNANVGFEELGRDVKTTTLDKVGLPRIDVIKIDVEGHEASVLEGASASLNRDRPVLIVEIEERHHPGRSEKIIDGLLDDGFQCVFLREGRLVRYRPGSISLLQPAGGDGGTEDKAGDYVNNFVFVPAERVVLIEAMQKALDGPAGKKPPEKRDGVSQTTPDRSGTDGPLRLHDVATHWQPGQDEDQAGVVPSQPTEDRRKMSAGSITTYTDLRPSQMKNPLFTALYAEIAKHQVKFQLFDFFFMPFRPSVIHVQFPEDFAVRRTLSIAIFKSAVFMFSLLWARMFGCKVIWTVNNNRSHEYVYPWLERFVMNFFVRRLDGIISMSGASLDTFNRLYAERAGPVAVASIPHPNYLAITPPLGKASLCRRRYGLDESCRVVTYFGLMRRYKGVESIIGAFSSLVGSNLRLIIAGLPYDAAYAAELEALTKGDTRIQLYLRDVPEDELPDLFAATDLFVAAFSNILNSGSVMLALSYDCSVLAPRAGSLPELQSLVGAEWLQLYSGELSGTMISEALDIATIPQSKRPDLSAMNLDLVAEETADFYRAVLLCDEFRLKTPTAAST